MFLIILPGTLELVLAVEAEWPRQCPGSVPAATVILTGPLSLLTAPGHPLSGPPEHLSVTDHWQLSNIHTPAHSHQKKN